MTDRTDNKMTRSIVLGLFAFVVVAVVAESNTNAVAEDPCAENGTEELCAFRSLLQGTLQRVNEALGSQGLWLMTLVLYLSV